MMWYQCGEMADLGLIVLQSGWIVSWFQKVFYVKWAGTDHGLIFPYVSDHVPVIAQFDFQHFPVAYPFKLNPSWMAEEEFTTIVKEVWLDTGFLVESDFQHRFVWKLKVLKSRIKTWARLRRRAKLHRLETLEEELRVAYSGLQRDGMGPTPDCHLKSLEAE
jgi:hypothetical protein